MLGSTSIINNRKFHSSHTEFSTCFEGKIALKISCTISPASYCVLFISQKAGGLLTREDLPVSTTVCKILTVSTCTTDPLWAFSGFHPILSAVNHTALSFKSLCLPNFSASSFLFGRKKRVCPLFQHFQLQRNLFAPIRTFCFMQTPVLPSGI